MSHDYGGRRIASQRQSGGAVGESRGAETKAVLVWHVSATTIQVPGRGRESDCETMDYKEAWHMVDWGARHGATKGADLMGQAMGWAKLSM